MRSPGSDFRYLRTRRILKGSEYEQAFRRGRKKVRPLLIIYCLPRESDQESRLGTAVSRKVGHAVVRNRVKRSLREAFRLLRPALLQPVDLVLVARPEAAKAPYAALEADLRSAASSLGLLPRPPAEAPQEQVP